MVRRRRALRATLAGVLAATAGALGPARPAEAESDARSAAAAAPAPFRPAGEDRWFGADGRLRVLYRPRFVPAAELAEGARSLLPAGGVEVGLDPLRRRLLFAGAPASLAAAEEAVAFLDVRSPSAAVEVTICEVARRCASTTGGHGSFDRGGAQPGPDTFFRSVRFDFEPEEWLRSELQGTDPFEGGSLRGANSGTGGPLAGTIEAVLRGLAKEGEADVLARPCLVLTERVPATVASRLYLPVTLFSAAGFSRTWRSVTEEAGVRLDVVAERIGTDHALLRIHPWIRRLDAPQGPAGPSGAPVLAIRELTTTALVRDGDELVLGGIEGWSRGNEHTGLPVPAPLAALAPTLGADRRERTRVDLLFRVRVRILAGAADPVGAPPPGEAARLARHATASAIPRPRAVGSPPAEGP